MARAFEHKKSTSLKGRLRDIFVTKSKPPETHVVSPPVISRPTRIIPKKKRGFTDVSKDENGAKSLNGSHSYTRQQNDSTSSIATIRPKTLKRQGSNDTIKASPPSKAFKSKSKKSILSRSTSHNQSPFNATDDEKYVISSPTPTKKVSFQSNVLDKRPGSPIPRQPASKKRALTRTNDSLFTSASTNCDNLVDDDDDDFFFDTKVTVLEIGHSPPGSPPDKAVSSLPPAEDKGRDHKRSQVASLPSSDPDPFDDQDEDLSSVAKVMKLGDDCRRKSMSSSKRSPVFTAEPTESTLGKRLFRRTSSFVTASPTKDALDDEFEDQFPDPKITVIDGSNAKEFEGADMPMVGDIVRVYDMPAPSNQANSKTSLRVLSRMPSAHNIRKLTERFNVTIVPCQKEKAVWDLGDDDLAVWPALLCITDKEFKATGFELRVPVKNIDIEFRSVDKKVKVQPVNGVVTTAEDPTGRPPAGFTVNYAGHSAPKNRLPTEISERRGICIESVWRTGPFPAYSSELEAAVPAGTSYVLKFHVPVPVRLFKNGSESRFFKVKSKVTMGDWDMPSVPAYSGVQEVLIEHLTKEKHMDGKKPFSVARPNARPTFIR